jgi:hypothetical protein
VAAAAADVEGVDSPVVAPVVGEPAEALGTTPTRPAADKVDVVITTRNAKPILAMRAVVEVETRKL